jgi:hypothetical protein
MLLLLHVCLTLHPVLVCIDKLADRYSSETHQYCVHASVLACVVDGSCGLPVAEVELAGCLGPAVGARK